MTIKNNSAIMKPKKGKQRDKQFGSRKFQSKDHEKAASVNSLPNTFKFAADALKIISERGGSAGSVVVSKYKSYNYKLIYALVMNTLKHIKLIKKLVHNMRLEKRVQESNPFMLEVLVGDLLYGKQLKSVEQNETASAMIKMKDAIKKQQAAIIKETGSEQQGQTTSAKYLRVNHLKATMEHVISQIKTVGLKQVEYSKDKIKFKKFINKFRSLEDNEFMLDFHFPQDLIVLKENGASKLKMHDLIKKGKAMLQDKASILAVEALGAQAGHTIVDACCAPGSKTSLIAGRMRNKGKILGFDLDKKRLLTAMHMLKKQGVTCAELSVQDFSKVKLRRLVKHNRSADDKSKQQVQLFDAILIDPSCSGSGIISRADYKPSAQEAGRLKKLQAFQVSLLKHAMNAMVSKTIVYCTCSCSMEENEQVLQMAMKETDAQDKWEVVEAIPYWPQRGLGGYDFGEKCVRSESEHLTNGFFIAKLQLNEETVQTQTELFTKQAAAAKPSGDVTRSERKDKREKFKDARDKFASDPEASSEDAESQSSGDDEEMDDENDQPSDEEEQDDGDDDDDDSEFDEESD